MQHQLVVVDDAQALAAEAARFVAERAKAAAGAIGKFLFAVSGGHTPWAMFTALSTMDLPWERVCLYQVDERVAGDGDPQRNLTHLQQSLGSTGVEIAAMPVTEDDLDQAAARYAEALPHRFDLVHLGLGPDGHTASLVPGDPVLDVSDRLVAVTARPYQGHRRMTLTYQALARAAEILWLVAGSDKREALAKLLNGDRSIPAGRVTAPASTVLADRDAAEGLERGRP